MISGESHNRVHNTGNGYVVFVVEVLVETQCSVLRVRSGFTDQRASVDRTSMDIDDGASLEFVDMFCYLGDTDMLSVDGNADASVNVSDGIRLDNLCLCLSIRMSHF